VVSRLEDWFVEQMGQGAEADGFSRSAGRLFGALLLSAEPRSLDSLVHELGVSKAIISIEARRLRERGVIERVGVAGDRRDYYQIVPHFFTRLVRARVARWATLHALAVQMREANPNRPLVVRDRLEEIEAMHDFVVARVEKALREWQARGAPDAQPAPRPRARRRRKAS
jgi:DNA-binding transcriptional regulator GbsR (MarR family)